MKHRIYSALITTSIAANIMIASIVAINEPVAAQNMDTSGGAHADVLRTREATNSAGDPAAEVDIGVAAVTDTTDRDEGMLAYIPESSWRTPELEGRELTEDLAQEYPPGNFENRSAENDSWGVGERLVFSIDYGFLNAGTATMSVLDTITVNGGACYHIRTTARSNKFISTFYEVNDRVDSYIDIDGLFSRRLEKHLREGKYESDRVVDFYHDRLLALNTQKKYAVTDIPLYVQDILSALYYIRTLTLEAGKTTVIDVYADGKVYPLQVVVHKREKIKVPAGTFETLKVEPRLKSEGLFRQKGTLMVWLTNDERKMPVKMTSEIVIGSIGTHLESFHYSDSE